MQLNNATVLLVDDEPDLLEIMSAWFERESSHVLVAENGAKALNVIQTNQVHAVVSDVHMPVMDGVTMLQKLKSSNTYRPSVMFITGFYDIAPREAYDLGAEDLLPKPVDRKHLISVVARILADRDTLWSQPRQEIAAGLLAGRFDGLEQAQVQGLLAFGHGGLCIHTEQQVAEGSVVDLRLDFAAEQLIVQGQGTVRWSDDTEGLVGVEITSIDDDARPWILSQTSLNKSLSFIPRSTAAGVWPTMRARA
jgi:CheY-like chemotaxis protein